MLKFPARLNMLNIIPIRETEQPIFRNLKIEIRIALLRVSGGGKKEAIKYIAANKIKAILIYIMPSSIKFPMIRVNIPINSRGIKIL